MAENNILTEHEQDLIINIEDVGRKLNLLMEMAHKTGLQVNVNQTKNGDIRQVQVIIVKPVGGINYAGEKKEGGK